jgi:hypothetical protein
MGAFVEGEPHLSWMQFFLSPFMPLILYFFILYCFFFKRLIRGHCPSVVTALPASTFTEMRRLVRDETPFFLAMQPRVTNLAW